MLVESVGGWLQPSGARPSGRERGVGSSSYCESVTWKCVGEVLCYILYHKQMQAYEPPGGVSLSFFFLFGKSQVFGGWD